jgi:hypothetical protein
MLSLFIPLAMVVLSCGQVSVHIGGNDGLSLLKNLTKSSPNLTGNDNATNMTINITENTTSNARGNLSANAYLPKVPKFIGNGGKVLLKNLSNSSLNLTGANNTTNLWTWGGKPLSPPVPSAEDSLKYQDAYVVKANRVE